MQFPASEPITEKRKKISICPLIIKLGLQPTQICHSEKSPQHHLCQGGIGKIASYNYTNLISYSSLYFRRIALLE